MVQAPHPGSSVELVVGAELGARFVVEALLGRGGMGAVYRVYDRALGERVALKTLKRELADDNALERFRREVRLARRITHQNVARTFDLGEEGGVWYLTMELLSGSSLRQVLRSEGKLSVERAAGIVAQMCDGLRAAHEAGVVHRDLKPRNVLLEADGRVVILDFGIAHSVHNPTLTASLVGTPAYMAPEQLGGGEPNALSDLYAVGLILHELLSGELPSWSGTRRDVIARLSGEPPELSLGDVPAPIVSLVERLLSPEPAARPASAAEIALVLRGQGDAAPKTSGAEPKPETRRFAPLPETGRVLAVMPFAQRGAVEGLGVELAEELVDALSRVQGLKVLASRAAARFGADADPEQVGRQVGADLIVSGTAQRRDDRVRITVRLIEASAGLQIWTERFEDEADKLLDFVDRTAQRIAEALRLEISIVAARGDASAEAIGLYLDGSRRRRKYDLDAFDVLDRAVTLAPAFRPALASRALAAARRAFISNLVETDTFAEVADGAIATALSMAPEYPETQLAAALLASQRADYLTAVTLLRRAVTIAPTFADAHEYLGLLQVEAGRPKEGVERLQLAMTLDPLGLLAVSILWKHFALAGDQRKQQAMLEELSRRAADTEPMLLATRLRGALWARDRRELSDLVVLTKSVTTPAPRALRAAAKLALGIGSADDDAMLETLSGRFSQPRFSALMHQYAAEACLVAGREDKALSHVTQAAAGALLDLEWLQRCPLLEPLHHHEEFEDALRRVRARAQAIWAV